VPGPRRRHLLAADGTRLLARYLPGPAGSGPDGRPDAPTLVLAHGFTGSWDRPEQARIAARFNRRFPVVAVDLRGHGGSTGASTLGHREVIDVAAAIRWARLLGAKQVVTVGFSMGGGAVVRQAAEVADRSARVAAVVAVSAPARWNYRGTRPMQVAHWAVGGRVRRGLLRRVRRTRVDMSVWQGDGPWPPEPRAAARVLQVPLLVVHGDADHYFPVDHATELGAGGTAETWLLPGFGHAENAVDDDLIDRIGDWVAAACPSPDAGLP
jgi:pimeloyl-ACP methyl ester carboxylesterase